MCSAIFLRITLICSTRSPSPGFRTVACCVPGAPCTGACAGAGRVAARCGAGVPDSIKLRMSFLVTRPLMPVPSSCLISTPCSSAIFRTSGLDFVRRKSSAVAPPLPGWVAGFAPPASLLLTSGFTSVLCAGGAGGGAAGFDSGAAVITGLGRSTIAGGSGWVTSGASTLTGSGVSWSFAAALSTAGFAPSSTATTVFPSAVSPSLNLISESVPAAGEGISASTLSVEISNNGSSRSTWSPTFFSHLVMVPSAMDSPICGITTSVAMIFIPFIPLSSGRLPS